MTPYYQDDAVTIFHGDCREILPRLEPVDLVLTDPPYGTGERIRRNGEYENTRQWWDNWDSSWMQQIQFRAVVAFVPPNKLAEMLLLPFPRVRLLAWITENPPCRNGVSPKYGLQPIVAFGESFDVTYALDWIKYKTNEQTDHPHEKPLSVILWAAQSIVSSGIILDPFMGSGTTLRAAKDLGRKAIGIEIEEKYCEIAARRMSQEVLAL
jgi:site-specific DNA-methyltransferase (adenine-specific)